MIYDGRPIHAVHSTAYIDSSNVLLLSVSILAVNPRGTISVHVCMLQHGCLPHSVFILLYYITCALPSVGLSCIACLHAADNYIKLYP